jgi:phosphoribosyl 1,2-cyclic phosphodiesterase
VRVRFWGTRGSIPVSLTWRDLRDRLVEALVAGNGRQLDTMAKAHEFVEQHLPFSLRSTYGGHTACVEFETGSDEYFVCDMGSGARAFGEHVMTRHAGRPATVNVFMSHVHWDHIMGFPFFGPAYVPGTRIRIHGCHEVIEHAFRLQQSPPCFPVPFEQISADVEFVRLSPGQTVQVSGVSVTPKLQLHGGDSYGYRFDSAGKSLVYTTDSEHKLENIMNTEGFVKLFRNADLVVFDAMYSLADAVSVKADWGHSSNVVGVELCQMARAKRLALFHHEPANDDAHIEQILRETVRFEELTQHGHRLDVIAAYDGLELDL